MEKEIMRTTNLTPKTAARPRLIWMVTLAVSALLTLGYARLSFGQRSEPKTFSSPGEASNALFQAVKNEDEQALEAILGAGKEVTSSSDEVEDKLERERFGQKYQEMHRLVREPDGTTVLYIGAERSEEHTSELQSQSNLVCRLLLEKNTARLAKIAETCQRIVDEMDFKFLLDPERKVFTIGYNVTEGRHDNSFYDLLASEARLASFVAIAKGDVPQEHWFRMGRQLTSVDGGRALISWTGTMFEYLMPLLVMRDYRETLLGQTYDSIVSRQIEYGVERGTPWGISESAFAARDLQLNYQYGPFGVPGLGLKRGLIEDLVVSPYSTILASNVKPAPAIENLRTLEREGALSRYGFYEALDYTPERVKKGEKFTLVRAYMAHHQGMSLVALDNLLNEGVMQNRFHNDPTVQATELLLQERIPRGVPAAHP